MCRRLNLYFLIILFLYLSFCHMNGDLFSDNTIKSDKITSRVKSKVFPILKNEKIGFINCRGEIVIQPIYDKYSSTYVFFTSGDEISYDQLFRRKDDDPQILETYMPRFMDGLMAIGKEDHLGIINNYGDIIAHPNFISFIYLQNGKLRLIGSQGRSILIDRHGNVCSETEITQEKRNIVADQRDNTINHLYIIDNQKLKNINKNGFGCTPNPDEIILQPMFHDPISCSKGIAKTSTNGQTCGLIDYNGNCVVPDRYIDFQQQCVSSIIPYAIDEKTWGVMNTNGKTIIQPKYDRLQAITFQSTIYFIVSKDQGKTYGLIDLQENFVLACVYKTIVPFEIDKHTLRVESFCDKKGLYHLNGYWILPPQYDDFGVESEGLRWVKKDGLYGYVDNACNIVIPPQYNWAEDFIDGLALVGVDVFYIGHEPCGGKWGYIDTCGNWIWYPTM